MSTALKAAVDELLEEHRKQMSAVNDTRRAINVLLRQMGKPPLFEADEDEGGATAATRLRPDLFFGKSLTGAVREYLEMRDQACSAEEIIDALQAGGFSFETLGWQKENRSRSLSMSLAKNHLVFVRVPSGAWGLRSRYNLPATRRGRKTTGSEGEAAGDSKGEGTDE